MIETPPPWFAVILVASVLVVGTPGIYFPDRESIREYKQRHGVSASEFKIWLRWRRWTILRIGRRVKYWFVISVIGAHSASARVGIALGLTAISYSLAQETAVVAAATVFYATMLFLTDQFDYPAMRVTKRHVSKIPWKGDPIWTANALVEVRNEGSETANDIQAGIRVVDPIKNMATRWDKPGNHITASSKSELASPLEPGRQRRYTFNLRPNRRDIIRFRGSYSRAAWIEIMIHSDDQPATTWMYRRFRNVERGDEFEEIYGVVERPISDKNAAVETLRYYEELSRRHRERLQTPRPVARELPSEDNRERNKSEATARPWKATPTKAAEVGPKTERLSDDE